MRDWYIGCAIAFQAIEKSSILLSRSNSFNKFKAVDSHLVIRGGFLIRDFGNVQFGYDEI